MSSRVAGSHGAESATEVEADSLSVPFEHGNSYRSPAPVHITGAHGAVLNVLDYTVRAVYAILSAVHCSNSSMLVSSCCSPQNSPTDTSTTSGTRILYPNSFSVGGFSIVCLMIGTTSDNSSRGISKLIASCTVPVTAVLKPPLRSFRCSSASETRQMSEAKACTGLLIAWRSAS